ncbi:hypothetical protein EON65_43885 [archaeon]|nr:MAG: hypothetical protein EON65_43885 [archaeon]
MSCYVKRLKEAVTCPITQKAMKFAVKDLDGHLYDNAAIMEWLNSNNTSPVTGHPLSTHDLTENKEL